MSAVRTTVAIIGTPALKLVAESRTAWPDGGFRWQVQMDPSMPAYAYLSADEAREFAAALLVIANEIESSPAPLP